MPPSLLSQGLTSLSAMLSFGLGQQRSQFSKGNGLVKHAQIGLKENSSEGRESSARRLLLFISCICNYCLTLRTFHALVRLFLQINPLQHLDKQPLPIFRETLNIDRQSEQREHLPAGRSG